MAHGLGQEQPPEPKNNQPFRTKSECSQNKSRGLLTSGNSTLISPTIHKRLHSGASDEHQVPRRSHHGRPHPDNQH